MRNITGKIKNQLAVVSLFILALLFFAAPARATCSVKTAATSISPPNITLQRDTPVGAQIGSEILGAQTQFFNCDTGLTSPTYVWGIKSMGTYVTTIAQRRVYSTNIAGIGYAVGFVDANDCKLSAYIDGTNSFNAGPDHRAVCNTSWGWAKNVIPTGQIKLTFYKTATTTGSGTVNSAQIVTPVMQDNGSWIGGTYPSPVTMNSFTVTTTACSVTNAAVKVPLGNVLSTAFTGTGTTAAEKNFTIDLDCDASTRVNLTLEGAKDSSGAAGVLALTQETSGTTASGVGVQVLYNNTPVTFGSMFNVGTATAKGAYTIPLTARYYQTADKVAGGQANSLATFTITYQ
ncbi:fimbrial protein [Enterobacter cloacae]|uniref:fimbrial protein n=1 Tax=Enterobacter cloacae TaxID=550 RepID=UPI0034A3357A